MNISHHSKKLRIAVFILVALIFISSLTYGIWKFLNGFKIKHLVKEQNTEQAISESSTQHLDQIDGWKVYRNDKYGFEIKYPPNYKINNNIDISPAIVSEDAELIISIYHNSKSASLQNWLKGNISQADTIEWAPIEFNSISGLKPPIQGNMSGGKDADVFFLSPDTKYLYHLIFSTLKSGKDSELRIFDQMLYSFSFIK